MAKKPEVMKYLIRGGESDLRLTTLIGWTSIRSKSVIQALRDHLQSNHLALPDHLAAAKNGMELSNFSKALSRLNEVAGEYEMLKESELRHINRCGNDNNQKQCLKAIEDWPI